MEGSDKGFSSSNTPRSPLVLKSSPSGSGENNENDTSQDQMNSKLRNPKKLVAKHFMSPTKSASSKIAFPKKKILAERNENSSFSYTQIRKIPDLEMKNSPLNSSIGHSGRSSSWFIPSKNCAHVSNDNGVVADSSLKPYDPYTNYLSPRPKYLRYDPNKRRTIFHHKLSGSGEGKDGTEIQKGVGEEKSSADAQGFLVSAQENCYTQENEEKSGEVGDNIDDDGVEEDEEEEQEQEEEEEEEEEIEEFEEKGWNLRGVLKFLLLLFVCFLSKTYVSSMNSSAPSPNRQAILGFKDEAVYLEVYGDGFLEVEERDSGLGVHNVLMVKEDDNLDMEDNNTEPVESNRDYEVGKKSELDDVKMVEVYNVEMVKNSEAELAEVDNVEGVESSEAAMVENDALHMQDSKEESVEYDSDSEVVKTCEVSKEVPLAVVAESKDIEGGEVYIAEAKTAPSDDASGNELVKQVEGSDQLKKPKTFQEDQTAQNTEGVKQPNMELMESHELPVNLVDEEFYNDGETKKVGSNILVVAGVFTFSIILASLSFVYRSKKGKTTSVEDSLPMLNPFTSIVDDKVARVRPVLEVEEEQIEKTMTPEFPAEEEEHIREEIVSSIRQRSLSISLAEATKEIGSYIHAPTIELLGEFVIKEVGSSHRKIHEESNASQKGLKSHPISVPSRPFSYVSTQDSRSHGSFTDERKILKKEGGKDGESKIELTTPVRRSSRLRNRSFVSP